MVNTAVQAGGTSAPQSLIARFIGVITAPRATFEAIVSHPKWFGMLALTTAIVAVCSALPLTTEAGREAYLETQVRQMESFGVQVNDETYQQMRGRLGSAPYTTAGSVLFISPIIVAIMSGILFVVFNVTTGGTATYKQLFTVVVHAGVIPVLSQMFTGPLNYFRGSMASATNLGVLLPMLPEGTFVARLASMIDLFIVWWVLVLAMGLAVLYHRRTQPIAVSLFAVYAAIAIIVAAIMSRVGGTN